MTDVFLGIDLGTSSVKVVAADGDGAVRGMGSAEYPTSRPHPGWAEQDAEDWWRATVSAVQQAVGWIGSDSNIAGIGLAGQMHGTVFLGENDTPLTPAVVWEDQRSARQAAEITARVGEERLIGIAGSRLATGFMAATAAWMQEERSSVWWRTKRLLLPKDELRRRLTGTLATDPGDGSGSLLLDARWRNWSPDLLDAAQISSILLPPVKAADAVAGELGAAAAEALGLGAGVPVVTGTGDAPSTLLGAGIIDPETVLLSLSTGAQVMVPDRSFHPDAAGRLHAYCSALEPSAEHPGWYRMGATLAAGLAMRWLRDEMLQLPVAGAYERMTGWAAQSPAGARGLLFLPYLVGERTPHMDPRARGAFLGLAAHHDRGDVVRAVMEGVTFACRDAFAALQEAGTAPERVVMAGGGGRSPFWRQMVADVFGLPVYGLATTEQSAMGAALLALCGIRGLDPVETAQRWAHYGPPAEPNVSRHMTYDEVYELFREAFGPIIGVSHRLGDWYVASTGPRVVPRPIRKRE